MAVTYPLTLPASPGFRASTFSPVSIDTINESPFTGDTQVLSRLGDRWQLGYDLPPMTRSQAAAWTAFLTKLRGRHGTFYGYDPDARLARSGAVRGGGFANLLLRSEEFDNSYWTKNNVTITANSTTAPDSTSTADKIEATTSASTTAFMQVTNAGRGAAALTYSIYAKQGSGATDANRFGLYNTTTAQNLLFVSVNYSSGAITYIAGSSGATVASAGSGWWRVSLTVTSGFSASDTIQVYLGFTGSSETAGEFLYAWGAQLERSSSASTYEKTTTGPLVNGASQTGRSLITDGWKASSTVLLAGDYIQVGTQLFMVTTDATSDASGNATLDIWPAIRSSPADNTTVTVEYPVGIFRLADQTPQWSANETSLYGISFQATEAVSGS